MADKSETLESELESAVVAIETQCGALDFCIEAGAKEAVERLYQDNDTLGKVIRKAINQTRKQIALDESAVNPVISNADVLATNKVAENSVLLKSTSISIDTSAAKCGSFPFLTQEQFDKLPSSYEFNGEIISKTSDVKKWFCHMGEYLESHPIPGVTSGEVVLSPTPEDLPAPPSTTDDFTGIRDGFVWIDGINRGEIWQWDCARVGREYPGRLDIFEKLDCLNPKCDPAYPTEYLLSQGCLAPIGSAPPPVVDATPAEPLPVPGPIVETPDEPESCVSEGPACEFPVDIDQPYAFFFSKHAETWRQRALEAAGIPYLSSPMEYLLRRIVDERSWFRWMNDRREKSFNAFDAYIRGGVYQPNPNRGQG